MNGYDVIEALGEAAEEYIEEAEQSGKAKMKKRWIPKVAAACALLLVAPAATVLAVDYFSSLKGDELAFGRVEYRGDGIVAIQVQNYSDKVLEFQEDVKLGIFYANEEISQTEGGSVRMEGNVIAPHSSSELIVDLSGAYDMAIADRPLTDDWYYLELTNNHFVFGQDWQCAIDFRNTIEEGVIYRAENPEGQEKEQEREQDWEQAQGEGWEQRSGEYGEAADFIYENWAKPVADMSISGLFGTRGNGSFSDHINIAGSRGEDVFAVESGTVAETGYEAESGNYIVLLVQDDVRVKYGYLESIYVTEGQEVEKGAVLGTLGKTGRAVGPNLLLALYVNDKPVNPLREESATAAEAPEMYPAADILQECLAASGEGSIVSGVMVPAFIAYKGAVCVSCDYDISGEYLMVSDSPVEFNPSYTYTAYEIVGRPDLAAVIVNGGYAVYRKAFDVVFSMDGVVYQVECPADYLGEEAAGELLGEKSGLIIYRAPADGEEMQGKCIVDISELMTQTFPEYFEASEEAAGDCLWVAAAEE
ncbi:MAG: M23 family metallopeptidase [Butyrivibrio sp.]|nr:M23 family metallopeptidase [Acetatifactor muris]MCM1561399.1 M23 family metallopeptidase [Butyrivibrio sp.]